MPFLGDIELLILDNLSTLCRSGEKNAAESWQPIQDWLLSLRRRGISVLMLRHSGKGETQRGTSKREDVLDTVIHLKHPSDYQPTDGARFEIHFEKARLYRGGNVLAPIEVTYTARDGRAEWVWKSCESATTERVATLLNEGLSQRLIAKELKLSVGTVNKHAKKARTLGLVKE